MVTSWGEDEDNKEVLFWNPMKKARQFFISVSASEIDGGLTSNSCTEQSSTIS